MVHPPQGAKYRIRTPRFAANSIYQALSCLCVLSLSFYIYIYHLAVIYIFIVLAEYLVNLKINYDTRKLIRTLRIIKTKKNISNQAEYN